MSKRPPEPEKTPNYATLQVESWLTDLNVPFKKTEDFGWEIQCPWGDHAASISQALGRSLVFKCGDPGCSNRTASDILQRFPPDIERHFTEWFQKEPEKITRGDPNYKPKVQVRALGYGGDGECYYQCSTTGHVVAISPESHKEGAFYGITPDYKYWCWRFGDPKAGKPNWKEAQRTLIQECHNKGLYDVNDIRGTGIYLDRGRLVVNAGGDLMVDGKPQGIFDFQGEFLYESRRIIPRSIVASDADLGLVYSLIKRFPFVHAGSEDIVAGMVVCGYLAGLLEWRPHAWAIGPKGSGKTELLKMVSDLLSPCGGRFNKGASTAAGVTQLLHNSATMVILDEQGEVHNQAGNDRIQGLVQLARNASTRDRATVAKGGSSGNGSEYMTRCCFLFGSIFHSITQPQDKDRFCFIPMVATEASKAGWPALEADLHALTPAMAASVFWRVAGDAREIMKTIRLFVETLSTVEGSRRRDADQWGTVLGGAWFMSHPGVTPTTEDVFQVFARARTEDQVAEEAGTNHGEIAVRTLLNRVPNMSVISLGEAVEECALWGFRKANTREYRQAEKSGIEPAEALLQRFGMRVGVEDGSGRVYLQVARQHSTVNELMMKAGFPNYAAVMLTYPGAKSVQGNLVFAGQKYSTHIAIPLEGLFKIPEPGTEIPPRPERYVKPSPKHEREAGLLEGMEEPPLRW